MTTFLIGYLIIGVVVSTGLFMYDYTQGTSGKPVAYVLVVIVWWIVPILFIIERMTRVKSN